MFRFFLLLYFFVITLNYAQTGGEQTFLILNTNTSARQTALGGKILTLLDNVNQPTFNPATINIDIDRKLSVNYNSYLAGISMGSASYAHRFNRRKQTFHTSFSYINYGELIEADENGNETGTFGASDIVFSLGYANQYKTTNFYWGTNLKFIQSSISNYNASGIAIDFGIIYYAINKPYILTAVIRNFGTQLSSFNNTKEPLPFEFSIGGSYRLENVPLRWYATIDNLQKWNIAVANPSNSTTDLDGNVTEENIDFFDNFIRHLSFGAELFPESAINLRVGYNFRRAAELQLQNVRSFAGLSFGFGLKMRKLKLNYAFSKYHLATNTSTFSLEIDLNKTGFKRKLPKAY